MKKFTEKALDYFNRHPSSKECHVTSDGRVFHTQGSAQSFAGTLDNQDIESFKKSVLEKEVQDNDSKNSEKVLSVTVNNLIPTPEQVADIITKAAAKTDVQDVPDADKAEKLKELEALELVSANYNEMKILVKYFDLKVENQKADTLITALTEFKQSLINK